MNTLKYQNNDEKKIGVDILDNAYAAKFLEKYQSFVKYTGLSELKIDFSVYGRLDMIQQREFNNLRKQSFISIPENAFKVVINRFNKRKWKRKQDSKPKPKKPKQSSQNPILHHQQARDSSPYLQAATMECDGSDIKKQTNTEYFPVRCNFPLDQIPNVILASTEYPQMLPSSSSGQTYHTNDYNSQLTEEELTYSVQNNEFEGVLETDRTVYSLDHLYPSYISSHNYS